MQYAEERVTNSDASHRLCGCCGTISPAPWQALGPRQGGEVALTGGEEKAAAIRCPACRHDHAVDERVGDPGVWAGTRGELEEVRTALLRMWPLYAQVWTAALGGQRENP